MRLKQEQLELLYELIKNDPEFMRYWKPTSGIKTEDLQILEDLIEFLCHELTGEVEHGELNKRGKQIDELVSFFCLRLFTIRGY
jgi:hypothetical protein